MYTVNRYFNWIEERLLSLVDRRPLPRCLRLKQALALPKPLKLTQFESISYDKVHAKPKG
jgi:hypothetical protein